MAERCPERPTFVLTLVHGTWTTWPSDEEFSTSSFCHDLRQGFIMMLATVLGWDLSMASASKQTQLLRERCERLAHDLALPTKLRVPTLIVRAAADEAGLALGFCSFSSWLLDRLSGHLLLTVLKVKNLQVRVFTAPVLFGGTVALAAWPLLNGWHDFDRYTVIGIVGLLSLYSIFWIGSAIVWTEALIASLIGHSFGLKLPLRDWFLLRASPESTPPAGTWKTYFLRARHNDSIRRSYTWPWMHDLQNADADFWRKIVRPWARRILRRNPRRKASK